MPLLKAPPIPSLDPWRRGDGFVARHLDQSPTAIRALARWAAARSEPIDPRAIEQWPGVIVHSGPNGETLASVNAAPDQYWVQKLCIKAGPSNDPVALAPDDLDPINIFLVDNIPEILTASSTLMVGQNVWVRGWMDRGLAANKSNVSDSEPKVNHKHYVMTEAAVAYVLFYVQLSPTSGSPGTQTTTSNFVYTVSDGDGNQIDTGKSPEVPRINGNYSAANKGTGYYDTSGGFHLLQAFETTGTGHC